MEQTLSYRTIKNSAYSFLSFIWPLLLSFVSIPIIIKGLGVERYGFFILLNASLTFFGLLDFGFGYTFFKRLSEHPEKRNLEELTKLFSSSLFLYLFIGLFSLLVLVLIPDFFIDLFKIPNNFQSSFLWFFLVLGCSFLVKMLTVPLQQIPHALQRLDISSKIALVSVTFIQLGSIIVVLLGYGILSLLIIQLLAAIFVFICHTFFWFRLARFLKFKFSFSVKIFKDMFKDGVLIFIQNTMSSILSQLDKIILGLFWGPSIVTYYSSAQTLPEKINLLSFSLSSCFSPVFSYLGIKENMEHARNIFRRSIRFMTFISGGLVVVVITFGYKFIEFWLGKNFADQASVALIFLAFTYFFMSINTICGQFLSGNKKLGFLSGSSVLLAVMNVLLVLILIPLYKINGAALAYLLSTFLIPFFLLIIEHRYLGGKYREIVKYYFKHFFKIFLIGFLSYILATLLLPMVNDLLLVIVFSGFTFMFYVLLFKLFGFLETEDVVVLKNFFGAFVLKFKGMKK
ncbi:MAG: oligosaccharide flippase family protein [Candidatus Magasanikbacteria bacterium]